MERPSPKVETAGESQTSSGDGSLRFTTRVLPWLLPVVMLAVYGFTLNRWVSPGSLGLVAGLEDLAWSPHMSGPVTWVVMRPFAFLPAAWIPLAVNLFTAFCAAVSLGFLARSVALLPHDLSKDPPPPGLDYSPPQLLSSRWAGLPPLLAVLVCGLQLTFWQNAISATGEMVNLLLFAFVIRCFLEYNHGGKGSWLLGAAFADGLVVANDWQMGFFIPFLLVGVLWVKRFHGADSFVMEQMLQRRISLNLHFLWQLPVCWLAGFAFVLFLPLLASVSASGHMDFWPALKIVLHSYHALTHLSRPLAITTTLICVMPVFLIGLRYYHFLAGASSMHVLIGLTCFQLVFAFFLIINLWTMFDTPLSPHRLAPDLHTLPFYWLEALSIGYFAGHFLLMAETPHPSWLGERRRFAADEQQRQRMLLLARALKWGAFAGVVLLVLGMPAALIHKNVPKITAVPANPVATYFEQVKQELPPAGAVVICPDATSLAYLQMNLIRSEVQNRYLLLNAAGMADSLDYWAFIQRQKHPGFDLNIPLPKLSADDTLKLISEIVLDALCQRHEIWCLHPAPLSDHLAEIFYFEPHGLTYALRRFPGQETFAPSTPETVMRENEMFWHNFKTGLFTNLVHSIDRPPRPPVYGLVRRFLSTLRGWPQADDVSLKAGSYYAVALDDWGVQLQRAGQIPAAKQCFAEALLLDTNNVSAAINAEFDADYQAGREIDLQTAIDTAHTMNQYGGWHAVLADGAVDEPDFCFMLGSIMSGFHLYRPAIAQFERVRQFCPTNLDTRLNLAILLADYNDLTNSEKAADDVLALAPTNETALFIKSNCAIQTERYGDAIATLDQLLAEDPTNNLALLHRAISHRCSHQFAAARVDYAAVIQGDPRSFIAYYDLALMDDEELDFNSAIANYKLFIQYAPAGTPELAVAAKRVKQLSSTSPRSGFSPGK